MSKFERMTQQQIYDYLEKAYTNQINESSIEIKEFISSKYLEFQNKYHLEKDFLEFDKQVDGVISHSKLSNESKDIDFDKLNEFSRTLYIDNIKEAFNGYVNFEQGKGTCNSLDYVQFLNDVNDLATVSIASKCGKKITPYADIKIDELNKTFIDCLSNNFADLNNGSVKKTEDGVNISSLNGNQKKQKLNECFERIKNFKSKSNNVYEYLNEVKPSFQTMQKINVSYNKLFQLGDYMNSKKLIDESKRDILGEVEKVGGKISLSQFDGFMSIDLNIKKSYLNELTSDLYMDMSDFKLPTEGVKMDTFKDKIANAEREEKFRKPINIEDKELNVVNVNKAKDIKSSTKTIDVIKK